MQAGGRHAWTEQDDALLDAILTLRACWAEHDGHTTLAACGLDARLATVVVSGLCSRHGQFVTEWTGRAGEHPPLEARCPASVPVPCGELSPVFVLV